MLELPHRHFAQELVVLILMFFIMSLTVMVLFFTMVPS